MPSCRGPLCDSNELGFSPWALLHLTIRKFEFKGVGNANLNPGHTCFPNFIKARVSSVNRRRCSAQNEREDPSATVKAVKFLAQVEVWSEEGSHVTQRGQDGNPVNIRNSRNKLAAQICQAQNLKVLENR